MLCSNFSYNSGDDEESKEGLLTNQKSWNFKCEQPASSSQKRLSVCLLVLLLLVSCCGNVVLLVKPFLCLQEASKYAQLKWNVPTPFQFETSYNSQNQTVADWTWNELSAAAGIIAISRKEAQKFQLPGTQPFPWDSQTGIYLIDGFHDLHCLKRVRFSIGRYRDGLPAGNDLEHAWHCIEALRQSIICHADDTPRYTGLDQPVMSTGQGQVRMCRSWNKLQSWAESHSGCWTDLDGTRIEDELERYTACPKGSPYWPKIHRWFPHAEEPGKL